MTVLTPEEIDYLEEHIEPFDDALRSAINNDREGDIARLFNTIRKDFGLHWNITTRSLGLNNPNAFYAVDDIPPSQLLCDFLRKSLDNPDLKGIDDFIALKDKIWAGELTDDDRTKYGYFSELQTRLDNLENTKESLKYIANWPTEKKDGATEFFLHSMDRESNVYMLEITETMEQTLKKCEEVLETVIFMRNDIFTEITEKADEELSKISDYLKEHEDAFNMMNLKLHDASYYEYSDLEEEYPETAKYYEDAPGESAFYRFCDNTYGQFTEWCEEESIDFDKMRHQVGRTSSFYLHDEGNGVCLDRRNYNVDIQRSLECLLDNLGYAYCDMRFTEDGKLDRAFLKECFPENMENLLYIAKGDFLKDVQKEYEDVIKVYDYISDTKEHQVEYFKEWLDNEEEWCKEQNEQEAEID